MLNLYMEDWEDLGLAIGVGVTVLLCFVCNFVYLYRQERAPEYSLMDPV